MFNGDEFPFQQMNAMGQMHRQMMQDMDMMMEGMIGRSMGGPFGFGGFPNFPAFGFGGSPFGALTDGTGHQQSRRRQQLEMNPFAGFGGLLGAMNQPMMGGGGGGNMFVSTKVMTLGPDGVPMVEQQTLHKNGDVTETKRRVDINGESTMSIGHKIGDRSHTIEKKRDKDGNVRKQQNFVNLDEASAEDFDREFAARIRNNYGYSSRNRAGNAIENGSDRRRGNRYGSSTTTHTNSEAPIITLPEEEEPSTSNRTTSRIGGPVIREISEEEAEQSIPKRRRGLFGSLRGE